MHAKVNTMSNRCPECGGSVISLVETGDIICNECGLVLDEKRVDYTNNGRRAYTKDEKND
jgi:transcription initiation factor TFIIIB Brf1 subunit/transcription initiation factor TFIIB